MRVLFIAPQPFFRERGSPIRALRQLEELSAAGHEVDVLCYPFGSAVSLPGVRIHRTLRPWGVRDVGVGPSLAKFPLDFFLMLSAFRMCLCKRYDVIQAVEEAAFFAVWFSRWFGCRLVNNLDSHLSDQLRYSGFVKSSVLQRWIESYERSVLRKSTYCVTVGSAISEIVRRDAPASKVLQLEDSPLEESFTEDRAGAERLRAELGLGTAPVAVYTGNFSRYQGVDLLVRAAGVLAGRRPEVRVVLAGGEPAQVERFKTLAGSVGAGRTCVFAGKRPTSDMNAFMTLADALLSPRTLGTNPPLKIYPYMLSGRVIVATDLATHTQVLDETYAMLAKPEPEAFAVAMETALCDRVKAAAKAAKALEQVRKHYSISEFRRKVRGMYADIAGMIAKTGAVVALASAAF